MSQPPPIPPAAPVASIVPFGEFILGDPMLNVGDRFWEDAGLEVGCMKAISRRSSGDTQKPLTGITNSRKTVGPQSTSQRDQRSSNFLPHDTQSKYWSSLIHTMSNNIDYGNNYFLPLHVGESYY